MDKVVHLILTKMLQVLKLLFNMKKTHTEFGDFASRNGSRTLLEKVATAGLIITLSLFILSLVGSAIWGTEGFVEVLANLIN